MSEGTRADASPGRTALPPAAPVPSLAEALRAGFDRQGPALLYLPDELKRHLDAQCPDAGPGIALILVALEEHVPQALLGTYADQARSTLTPHLADQLHARRGVDRGDAAWVVETWTRALRIEAVVASPAWKAPTSPRANQGSADGAIDPPDDPPRETGEPAPEAPTVDGPALWSIVDFRPWHGVVGIVVVIALATAVVALFQNRVFSRSDSDRVLDALSAPRESATSAPPAPAATVVGDSTPAPAPEAVAAPESRPAAAPEAATPVAAPTPTVATAQPPRAAAIVDIAVPADVVTGKRFAVTIGYRTGDRKPLAIERRTVDGTARAKDAPVRTQVAKLSQRDGTLRYPFAAAATPSRRTFEFTLIDADGRRSASKRVVVDVVRAASPAPAVACTRETCGSVQSIRAIEPARNAKPSARASARRYEVMVRLDDRSARTVVQGKRLPLGSRVRWSNGRLTALPTTAERGRAAHR